MTVSITVGVLALQGAFFEHTKLLKQAAIQLQAKNEALWVFTEVRTAEQLDRCDALIIPGGESTTSANRTKKGGQDLIGGLDVRVNRNYFGRQTESFEADLDLPFLSDATISKARPFRGVFIRAPVVEEVLAPGGVKPHQEEEASQNETVIAPSKEATAEFDAPKPVEVMATLPGRSRRLAGKLEAAAELNEDIGDIVAVRQRNVFGTSFHPELTPDARIHGWWLQQVLDAVGSGGFPQAPS
ncbi:MAG: hypothetical protein LQ348_004038 [Seirophora lacunosa]|nr:MAG: hypothetical protein LQ348_004038 [Seirophora lacunosa]